MNISNAEKKYFGKRKWKNSEWPKEYSMMADAAFEEWMICFYRPKRGDQTVFEQLMDDEELPQAFHQLYKARSKTYPSIYQVVDINPGKSILFEDLLLGGTVTVHDRDLSGSIPKNTSLALTVFPVGDYHFISIIGPPMRQSDVRIALKFLQGNNVRFTPDGLRKKAEIFGRLWEYLDGPISLPPRLVNFDGDLLELITATYAITDRTALIRALRKRKDIDADGDEFVWSGESRDKMPTGGPVTLARMEIVADELLVEVNSRNRLERVRQWLDSIPGITFKQELIRDIESVMKETPSPDSVLGRQEPEFTPEQTIQLQEALRSHYFEWLDMPIPALGTKTPRETWKNKKLRQKVQAMIRSMPEISSNISIPVPKEEMLRELDKD